MYRIALQELKAWKDKNGLKVFRNKYTPKVSVRTSLRDIKLDDGLLNLPLYELFNLTRILDAI